MAVYDYLMLRLARGPAARAAFVERVAAADLAEHGAAPLGLFVPQLGWEASQAALLVERDADAAEAAEALHGLVQSPEVVSCDVQQLRATVRPSAGERLKPGGIYVHRRFTVAADAFGQFVALSAEAWPDFESRFEANIFGLFEVMAGGETDGTTERELLLITRYADHGVWEASRDPTTAAMQTFARRAALTLSTRGASTLLVNV